MDRPALCCRPSRWSAARGIPRCTGCHSVRRPPRRRHATQTHARPTLPACSARGQHAYTDHCVDTRMQTMHSEGRILFITPGVEMDGNAIRVVSRRATWALTHQGPSLGRLTGSLSCDGWSEECLVLRRGRSSSGDQRIWWLTRTSDSWQRRTQDAHTSL